MLKNENSKVEAVTSCHQILMIQNLKSQRSAHVLVAVFMILCFIFPPVTDSTLSFQSN